MRVEGVLEMPFIELEALSNEKLGIVGGSYRASTCFERSFCYHYRSIRSCISSCAGSWTRLFSGRCALQRRKTAAAQRVCLSQPAEPCCHTGVLTAVFITDCLRTDICALLAGITGTSANPVAQNGMLMDAPGRVVWSIIYDCLCTVGMGPSAQKSASGPFLTGQRGD